MPIQALITMLVFFAVVAGIVYAIYAGLSMRNHRRRIDPGIGTVKRLYFYVVAFVTLMMAVNGVILVAADLFERVVDSDVVSSSTTGIAWGLALFIVGAPLWAFHWRAIRRYVAEVPVEKLSFIRKLYLYLVLSVCGGLVAVGLTRVLFWAFGTTDFSGFAWASVVIAAIVWMLHWILERKEGQDSPETLGVRRIYLYLGSLVGVSMLTFGVARIVHVILVEGYMAAFSVPVMLPSETGLWRHTLRDALAVGVVGGGMWAFHWLRIAVSDRDSSLRLVYLYVYTILGGAITALVGAGIIVNRGLEWLLRVPNADPAVAHFEILPSAIATLTVGVTIWAYHWWEVRSEDGARTTGSRRAYIYLVTALGLGTVTFASFTLVNTALALLTERTRILVSGEDLWKEPIALVLTLAAIGAPLLVYYWRDAQSRVTEGVLGERTSLSRRTFLFTALGAGVLAAVGSVSGTLFVFLRDLLDASLSIETVRDIRPAIGVAVTSGAFLPYFWSIYRTDRDAAPVFAAHTGSEPKQVSVLTVGGVDEIVLGLEAALGYEITELSWADPDASTPHPAELDYEDLARQVAGTQGASVLLVPDGDGFRVLSHD
ncbi:MAG: DUF5671 domain-containing protein [SAR202 cluster bacterium]|nr:DUF5671 domain-containing protein [SAR202 cluster bacterium]